MAATVDIDALVAHYAPLGRRRRRMRRLQHMAGVAGTGVGLALLLALWNAAPPGRPAGPALASLAAAGAAGMATDHAAEIETLRARLAEADLALLAGQQAWQEQRDQLMHQVAELKTRQRGLEERQAALLARAGAAADAKTAAMRARLEAELAELAEQRRLLGEQRREFDAQRRLVATELDALRNQRADLERQRQALETQREEFQVLLSRFEAVGRVPPTAGRPDPASVSPPIHPPAGGLSSMPDPETGVGITDTGLLAGMVPVTDETLGEMRGAFRVPGGYDVSLGLTRSTSINGVEQFSNAISLDSLQGTGAAIDGGSHAVLIQIGDGNIVGTAMLDAIGNGMGTVIQNTMDQQVIQTKTVLDIALQDVSTAVNGLAIHQAIGQSLGMQP